MRDKKMNASCGASALLSQQIGFVKNILGYLWAWFDPNGPSFKGMVKVLSWIAGIVRISWPHVSRGHHRGHHEWMNEWINQYFKCQCQCQCQYRRAAVLVHLRHQGIMAKMLWWVRSIDALKTNLLLFLKMRLMSFSSFLICARRVQGARSSIQSHKMFWKMSRSPLIQISNCSPFHDDEILFSISPSRHYTAPASTQIRTNATFNLYIIYQYRQ